MTTRDFTEQTVAPVAGQNTAASLAHRGETPVKSIIWAILDFVSAIIAGLIAFRIRFNPQTLPWLGRFIPHNADPVAPRLSIAYLVVFAAYLLIFSRLYGLYRTNYVRSTFNEQRMTLQATLTAALMLCGTLYVMHAYEVSRMVAGLTVLLTLTMIMPRRIVWRMLLRRRFVQGQETRNVLIVGDGRVGQALRNYLESSPHMGFRFKGFIALENSEASNSQQVIGNVHNCVSMARSLFVDEIYFSSPADKTTVISVVEEAREAGIEVRVVPDLYDGLAWNAPVEFVGQFPTISLHRRDFRKSAHVLKLVMDITLSFLALVLLMPAMVIIAVLIKFDSPGPVFYTSIRIGRKGRTFKCYKFRTMQQDADKIKHQLAHLNEREGMLFKVSNDPRITRLGVRLRKYSLDELPQFFNVLMRDMSLVGPRPPLQSEAEQYDVAHLRRLDVLPGITGLWQVQARQDPSFDNYISLDTAYIENWNLLLDARILARTVEVVLAGTGT